MKDYDTHAETKKMNPLEGYEWLTPVLKKMANLLAKREQLLRTLEAEISN